MTAGTNVVQLRSSRSNSSPRTIFDGRRAVAEIIPHELVSAAELGFLIGGLSASDVEAQERAGLLFSEPIESTGNEARFLAFQAWPEIYGPTLETLLRSLSEAGKQEISGFFYLESTLLRHLTPVEMLLGQRFSARRAQKSQQALLRTPAVVRKGMVLDAAHMFVIQTRKWRANVCAASAG